MTRSGPRLPLLDLRPYDPGAPVGEVGGRVGAGGIGALDHDDLPAIKVRGEQADAPVRVDDRVCLGELCACLVDRGNSNSAAAGPDWKNGAR